MGSRRRRQWGGWGRPKRWLTRSFSCVPMARASSRDRRSKSTAASSWSEAGDNTWMRILCGYPRDYWKLAAGLVLAASNQAFLAAGPAKFWPHRRFVGPALPGIFGRAVLAGVTVLLGAAVGVAFVSQLLNAP